MAMYDWNYNDKKDWQDNYIEYKIYKDVTGKNDKSSYTPSRGNGMFAFGAILNVIAATCDYYFVYGILSNSGGCDRKHRVTTMRELVVAGSLFRITIFISVRTDLEIHITQYESQEVVVIIPIVEYNRRQ